MARIAIANERPRRARPETRAVAAPAPARTPAYKLATDLVGAAVLLVVSAPAVLVAAILVKLTSRGPAIYAQARVGRGGRVFTMYKLRTMYLDSERETGPTWAAAADPRVTPVGRLLRRTHLDEFPQLWNVLRGDMSIVGPRPERPQFVADLEQRLPYYAERHVVKPGITGWAQINYPYGASVEDAREKLEFDLYYAKNYTPFLDLLILLQTARVVIWPEGAR